MERVRFDRFEADSLKQAGFDVEHIASCRPEVGPACDEALVVWRLMGGWFPERLPVILAMMEVEHVDGLFERLVAILNAATEVRDG